MVAAWSLVHFLTALFSFNLIAPVTCQQAFTPAVYPLAVRSPYLSVWQIATNATPIPDKWPQGWSLSSIYGWQGFVRVDNTTYNWMGEGGGNATTPLAVTVTPTRTIYTIPAGPMRLNVTYLSPIEPGDMVRQSMPFSYMYVEATSVDGRPHVVSFYADISAEWASGDRQAVVTWDTNRSGNSVYHEISTQSQSSFTETADQAGWGTSYHATISNPSNGVVTDMTGDSAACRGWFLANGTLTGIHDIAFRSISQAWPGFAFSWDFDSIQSTPEPVVFAVGYARNPAVQYVDLSNNALNYSLYFMTRYSDMGSAIDDFLSDFSNARQRAETLDDRILHAAADVSPDYQDLVSLAVRQVYGATELTVAMGTDGNWNTSDVMMFMKNIGGTTTRRVNPVEILYAAWPMFMYLDPALGPPLLEPLLRFQNSPAWPNPYAAQDAGQQYPAVNLTTGMHNQRIEQTSNMIIMAYAHMVTAGDSSLVTRYYNLLKSWADFLVQNSMDISDDSFQEASVDGEGGIQPNLAVKGIIAVKAMSLISSKMQQTNDSTTYSANATALTASWKSTALTDKNRILGSFGNNGSWTLGYNVFADAWLKTGIVDQDVFQAQSDLFTSLLTSGQKIYQYGLPIDSQSPLNGAASSSWNMFAASSTSDNTTRNAMISLLRSYASYNGTNAVFADIYDSDTGQASSGQASPAQGAMFAPLVLNQIGGNSDPSSDPSSSHTSNGSPRVLAGAIAGGVVGGIALVGCITVLVIWLLRRRKRERTRRQALTLEPEDQQEMSWVTPFTPYYDTSTGGSQSALAIGQHQATPSQTTSDSGRPMLQEAPSTYTESAAARKRRAALGISTSGPPGEDLRNPDPESAAATPSGAEASRNLEREVERLRREMEVIRAERARDLAPPSYDETRAAND